MIANPPARDEHVRLWKFLWATVALFTLYAATLPFDFVTDPEVVRAHLTLALGQPALSEPSNFSRPDVLQNILLFIPFGLLGVVSLERTRALPSLALTVLLAAVLSSTCEVMQLFTVDRTTSAWDVAANTAGAVFGNTAWLAIRPAVRPAWNRLALSAAQSRHVFPLLGAVALVCIAAWEPFDVTLDVGTVWAKVKPLVNGIPMVWQPLTDELLTGLRFAILAMLLTKWIQAWRHAARSPRWASLAVCALLAAALEATQFLITSRSPSTQDLVVAWSGVLAGTVMAAPILPSAGVTLLAIATIVAAIPFYLQPFDLAPAHRPFQMLPFFAYYEFTSLQTVSHVVDLMLIYAPIGFAIEWCRGQGGMARAALLTGLIASTLEYAQGWIVGRFPDVTDVGMAVLGGVAGAVIARYGPGVTPNAATGVSARDRNQGLPPALG